LKYFYKILILLSVAATSQAQVGDTTKVKHDFRPTGVRVGTDLIAIVRSHSDKTFAGWEFNGDVDFYRYYLAVDYGHWGRTYASDTSNYSNSGNYFRIGVDVNFLKKDPDRNMFFIGFRYARSSFNENLSVVSSDPVWGSLNGDFSNSNVPAQWMELTTGLRVKVWKIIWLGYTARLKFGLSTGDTPEMLPHDVPGYGRAQEDSYWGFNYQILIRLPVRKQP
jgi:hypothetical protein